MPKVTFENISIEKKERIINSALQEFGRKKFSECKVSNIVKNSAIARGSFYQYFDDMYDLYRYLMELAGKKKMENISTVIKNIDGYETREILKSIYETGLKFAAENKDYAMLGLMFLKEENDFKEKIFEGFTADTDSIFKLVLEKGVKSGELDVSIDIDVAAHMFTTMHIEMMQFIISKMDVTMDNLDVIIKKYDKVLDILMDGIKKK